MSVPQSGPCHAAAPHLLPPPVVHAGTAAVDRRATRAFLDEYFRKIALQERATIVSLAFLQTHAHLLIRTGPRYDLPRLVQLLKGGSSYAASRQPGNVLGLRWNREYSATSVSPKLVPQAVAYIERQDDRHPSEPISP